MPPEGDDDRRVEIYFGPSTYTSLSKDDVGTFLTEKMGLQRSDGGPKWTEGITTLIKLGMDAWEKDSINSEPELRESIYELERKIDEYQQKIEDLTSEQVKMDHSNDLVHAADLVHRTEARILEVLCRDEHIGAKSPNYVDIQSIAKVIDLKYATVYQYVKRLNELPCGELVQFDLSYEQAKATSENTFMEYCDTRGFDSEAIKRENGSK